MKTRKIVSRTIHVSDGLTRCEYKREFDDGEVRRRVMTRPPLADVYFRIQLHGRLYKASWFNVILTGHTTSIYLEA